MPDIVDHHLTKIVADAIKEWNADDGNHWRHVGFGEQPDAEGMYADCAAWGEGLFCCTDSDHPGFDTLVGAIVDKLKPLADSLAILSAFRKALDDIATLDTDIDSPNSVNWRATLLYATQRAQQVQERPRSAQEPSGG